MITMSELLKGVDFNSLPAEYQANGEELLHRINLIRIVWGKPMIVTSGFRSMADHLRIYAAKGITDQSKIPMKSKHLIFAAVDISDPSLELTKLLKAEPDLLVDAALWCEEGNSNWLHAQIFPPKSNNRWFLP